MWIECRQRIRMRRGQCRLRPAIESRKRKDGSIDSAVASPRFFPTPRTGQFKWHKLILKRKGKRGIFILNWWCLLLACVITLPHRGSSWRKPKKKGRDWCRCLIYHASRSYNKISETFCRRYAKIFGTRMCNAIFKFLGIETFEWIKKTCRNHFGILPSRTTWWRLGRLLKVSLI